MKLQPTFSVCEDLDSLKHVYLGFFLDPEDMKSLSLEDILNLSK